MPLASGKAVLLTGAALLLAACNTTNDHVAAGKPQAAPAGAQALASAQRGDVTGSIDAKATDRPRAADAKPPLVLPGDEPGSGTAEAIAGGRAAYRSNQFREAERLFRRATQLDARSSEAWIGLAASADRLRDFAQADRAYSKAREIAGPTAEVLNNQGYSYMLRGDLKRARETLSAAQKLDPSNKYVTNNLALLASSESKAAR